MTDLRALALKAAKIGIIGDDPAGDTMYWSPTLYKIIGLAADGQPSFAAYLDLVHPEDREAVREAIEAVRQASEEEYKGLEHRLLRPDGQVRWLSMGIQSNGAEGGPARSVWSVTDITDWKARQEEASPNEARLAAILSIAPSAIISIDAEQRITHFNDAAEKLFGYEREEVIGKPLEILIPHRFRSAHRGNVEIFGSSLEKARRMGERQEVAGLRKDGSGFPAEASIAKVDVGGEKILAVALQDITERKAAAELLANMNKMLEQRVAERTQELEIEMKRREDAQRQLIQSQRMEAFGQLTGGIAHDFNNLLAVIGGSLELLEPDVKGRDAQQHLERAINAAEMGARLTSRLLTFARRRRLEPTIHNLNEQVTGLLELLRRTLGEQIILRTSLATELWLTRADPSEAENAILNLALNARDAMPNGGRLIVETENVTIDQGLAAELKGTKAGDYVRFSVSDSGVGIASNILQKVFEPFFTTKGTGRGTGLGLSTVYGFATQSGGTVTIYSEVGKGTSVSIYLPRILDAGGDRQTASRHGNVVFSKNNERVLVVEDNPEVRETTLQRVEGLGYVVAEAANGPDAIKILSSDPDIALVFSDIVMSGGMSGYELGHWVREHKPEIKVLLTSGFAPQMADLALEDEFSILRKPFNRVELSRALSRAIYGSTEAQNG